MPSQKIDLDEYVLALATDAQWRRAQHTQLEEWGSGLTVDQFTQRESFLNRELEWGKQAFQAWVLVHRQDTASLEFVSSVETFKRPVLVSDGRGNVREEQAYSIASVFTPEQHRRKGFASHMMVLLHDELPKDGILSFLYSDVGDFYARTKRRHLEPLKRTAWEICSPKAVTWPVGHFANTDPQHHADIASVSWQDFSSIAGRDAKLLHAEMASLSYPAFVLQPTGAQLEWIAGRARFYDSIGHPKSRKAMPHLEDWGVQIGTAESPNWAFAVWTFDLFKNILHITRLRCSGTEQLDVILSHAAAIARKYGMTTIDCWNVPESLLNADSPYRNILREDHLPALAWYGKGARPAWKHNEHWTWC